MNPMVSVIMNCYNSDKYLNEAIDSVYSQEYKNWEIIFWDNASSDESSKIAQSYDTKLRYFRAKNTTSLGEARVLAVEKSRGKYLAFLDCDDYWYPKKLLKQIKLFIEDDQTAAVYSRAEFLFEDSGIKTIFPTNSKLFDGFVFEELLKENFIPFPSVVLDKEKFLNAGGFPSHFKCATDYWVLLHLAIAHKFRSIEDVSCCYRIHETNLSNSLGITSAKESIELVSQFLPDKRAKVGLKHQYVNLAISYYREKSFFKSFQIIFRERIICLSLKRIIGKIVRIYS